MGYHLLAGTCITLSSLFLLRGVFLTPGVLSFDDLIPFLHIHQIRDFMVETWNTYYQWPEVRGRYSLLGLPLRYGPVIPSALFLVCWLAGLGSYSFAAHMQRSLQLRSGFVGALTAGLIYMLLLFVSKAHQFYSLFLGAALLPWMSLACLKSLSPGTERRVLWACVTALLLVINPSIHLVLLGYGILTLFVLGEVMARRVRAAAVTWITITIFGLAAYGFWLWIASPGLAEAASASVPSDLRYIQAWSGTYLERLVLPIGLSLPESLVSDGYVSADALFKRYPVPTALFVLYPILAVGALWTFRKRLPVLLLGLLWVGSVFMATGVQYSISGYSLLLPLTGSLGALTAPLEAVLDVLRNPERWLLPATLALTALAAVGLTVLLQKAPVKHPLLQVAVQAITFGVVLLPFLLHPAFGPASSGDLGGVLRPVPLPAAYREALTLVDHEKTLYLPLMGGARPLRWDSSKRRMADESFALLHGGPSMEGATGSPLLNQLYLGYAYFELLYRQKTTRIGRYLALVGIHYIFFHDDVEKPLLPDEFVRVRDALKAQQDLTLIYQRDDVLLFENQSWRSDTPDLLKGMILFDGSLDSLNGLLEAGTDPYEVGLIHVGEGDLNWEMFSRWVEILGPRVIVYAPAGDEDFLLSLLVQDVATAAYPKLGWDEETLRWRDHRWLNMTVENFLRFAATYGRFGVDGAQHHELIAADEGGARATFSLPIAAPDSYVLFLRAFAPQGARLSIDVDGLYQRELVLEPSDFYRFTRVDRLFLRAGVHKLTVRTLSNVPIVINLINALSEAELAAAQSTFLHLKRVISWANDPDDVLRFSQAMRESEDSSIALYGYYGERYWDQRKLVSHAVWAHPWRSWLVGSLYSFTPAVSVEELRLVVERDKRP